MEFNVLGPLEATDQGVSFVPTAPKPRQLLALLILNMNQVLTTSACIEELWEHEPPSSAASTLQTYVLHIRRSLAALPQIGSLAAARRILATRERGYFLARSDEYDLDRFEQTVQAGRQAMARGDDRTGACLLAEALRLWRGQALVDVQAGPLLRARLIGLEESRLTVLEQRIEADLRLGRHHELLSELSGLAARYPLHENLHAQAMIALYRSGRQAQALDLYQGLRRRFDRELGLAPSLRLRRLQQAVLTGDPALDAPCPESSRLSLDLASAT